MRFKAVSYLELWQPLCSAERNHLCKFYRRHHEEQLGPVIQEMFKDISYLELWQPFCSAEQNHLCNLGRGYHEERFCEIILNLYQWFRRRCFLKIFLIWSSCDHFVQRRGTICAILVKSIMRNNSVKLF